MEIFAIPITQAPGADKFIIYRPLTGLAFIGNRAMADIALSYKDKASHTLDNSLEKYLEAIGFFDPDPSHRQKYTVHSSL